MNPKEEDSAAAVVRARVTVISTTSTREGSAVVLIPKECLGTIPYGRTELSYQ